MNRDVCIYTYKLHTHVFVVSSSHFGPSAEQAIHCSAFPLSLSLLRVGREGKSAHVGPFLDCTSTQWTVNKPREKVC